MGQLVIICLLSVCLSGCSIMYIKRPDRSSPVCVDTTVVREKKVWIEAKTNKIWVNQHVDESGDLIDGHYKYVVITPGHWATEGSYGQE